MLIIEIKNIGKRYKISHQRKSYLALRDIIGNPIKYLKEQKKEKRNFGL